MELLQRLHQTLNITIIMVIHDINHAVRYSNRVVLVKNGKVVKDGHPFNVITDETIRDVFGVKIKILTLTDSHCHMNIVCVPYEIK
jgi:iron complex transport system ATP-binding protein